jgi:hypothetical protein
MFTGEIKNQISLTEVSFAHPLAGSPHILAIPSLFLTAAYHAIPLQKQCLLNVTVRRDGSPSPFCHCRRKIWVLEIC